MRLCPFCEFEAIISPLLHRVAFDERVSLLREIYALATKKMRMENIKELAIEHVKVFRGERQKLQRKRAHFKNAIRNYRRRTRSRRVTR
jgi:hypothetical protein